MGKSEIEVIDLIYEVAIRQAITEREMPLSNFMHLIAPTYELSKEVIDRTEELGVIKLEGNLSKEDIEYGVFTGCVTLAEGDLENHEKSKIAINSLLKCSVPEDMKPLTDLKRLYEKLVFGELWNFAKKQSNRLNIILYAREKGHEVLREMTIEASISEICFSIEKFLEMRSKPHQMSKPVCVEFGELMRYAIYLVVFHKRQYMYFPSKEGLVYPRSGSWLSRSFFKFYVGDDQYLNMKPLPWLLILSENDTDLGAKFNDG